MGERIAIVITGRTLIPKIAATIVVIVRIQEARLTAAFVSCMSFESGSGSMWYP